MKSRKIQLDDRNLIVITEINPGMGLPKSDYAQIMYDHDGKRIEWGFISSEGIFLKMEHPVLSNGVWEKIVLCSSETFSVKDRIDRFIKYYKAIYDRYSTIIRGK